MTYCLGISVKEGLVLAADSRTNAGVDYISSYQKLFDFSLPGERVLVACVSGNLSVTQAVVHQLGQDIKTGVKESLHTIPTMYEIARYIGDKIRAIQDEDRIWLDQDGIKFQCNFLVGGQLPGEPPEVYLVYSQGNCIKTTPETPFLQIGETKYGKPILDRTLTYGSSLDAIAKCALLSIDSTMRSNISVGPPINMVLYEANSYEIRHRVQLQSSDPYLAKIRKYWEGALREATNNMPTPEWNRVSIDAEPDFTLE